VPKGSKSKNSIKLKQPVPYKHPEAKSLMRPEVGTQAQFKKKKQPKSYRYDSSLSPGLDWDEQNPAREQGEQLIKQVLNAKSLEEAKAAASKLKSLSQPFLNWAGKAERLSFNVPTLPLFIHERLSTKAIIETLAGHKIDQQQSMFELFGDPQRSITDQVLKAYEYQDDWTNRMIMGDSLVVMNSLLHYEGLGGQVQMIYMDPPYGVKFGSNFQPFVRKRDVSHNDDEDMTREPEMVQAYRDTWELGLHSYLTYLRDRLLLARDLLTPSGSIFVQISDENLHHVREVMDEVFGAPNACRVISVEKTSGQSSQLPAAVCDFLLWYAKDKERAKVNRIFVPRDPFESPSERYVCVETADGRIIDLSVAQKLRQESIPEGRILKLMDLFSQTGSEASRLPIQFNGKTFVPSGSRGWSTHTQGIEVLKRAGRLHIQGNSLWWKSYRDEFPFREVNTHWSDAKSNAFGGARIYVVQTNPTIIERCLLMTTDPGDLVLDPTCGSGTSAYVAEQWGRRWITVDTSRVPLALTRQRLLTAMFPWYELKDDQRGPAGGFTYVRKQNKKGEEVGGIVPHITLKSIANNEPPQEEVLVDRPEVERGVTRVTGPFCLEATIPTPVDWEGDGVEDSGAAESHGSFVDRMLEVLRKSPVLRLEGNKTVTLKNIRPPAKTLSLSGEAIVDATATGQKPSLADAIDEAEEKTGHRLALSGKPVALVFGPENGAVSEKLVYEAAREAHAKRYTHLYVIGFAIQSNARTLVDKCAEVMGVPATYVQATPDLMMGDLLKNMRSSQIFSVCGQPEIQVKRQKEKGKSGETLYQVELLGLDVFDPATMEVIHKGGADVPAWFLDTDYNDLCFHVSQAFFPRTSAWDNLKKALKGEYEESVWNHLSGTTSAPFEAGEHRQIAVKVIDDRGNELLLVKKLA
jgi:adenine-specific DNA-methyltransferase